MWPALAAGALFALAADGILHGARDDAPPPMPLAHRVGESSRPQPNCSIVIDRHNHKTGGTTMRDIFLHNMHAGACLYWGYGPAADMWERFLAYLEASPPDGATLFRMCIEAHFRVSYFERSVPRLAAVRAAAAQRGCTLTLVTRLREPLSFYLSYYRWAIMGRQRAALECERARAEGGHRTANMPPGLSCPPEPQPEGLAAEWAWGRDFTEWARRTPNLQSRLLLDAGASRCVEQPHRPGCAAERARGAGGSFGSPERARLHSMLERFDVVGTTEAFDAQLLLVQQRTGLPDVRYARASPSFRYLPPGEPPLPLDHPSVCANHSACVALVQAVAPYDHELYARFGAGLDARAAEALGGEAALHSRLSRLRERVRALEALRRALDEDASARDAAQRRRQAWRVARQQARGQRPHGPKQPRAPSEAPPAVPLGPWAYHPSTRSQVSLRRVCRLHKSTPPARARSSSPPAGADGSGRGGGGAGREAVGAQQAPHGAGDGYARGGTACMPVPAAVARIWQQEISRKTQRPARNGLSNGVVLSMEESSPRLDTVRAFATWARGHRGVVMAAELPLVPPACPEHAAAGGIEQRLGAPLPRAGRDAANVSADAEGPGAGHGGLSDEVTNARRLGAAATNKLLLCLPGGG